MDPEPARSSRAKCSSLNERQAKLILYSSGAEARALCLEVALKRHGDKALIPTVARLCSHGAGNRRESGNGPTPGNSTMHLKGCDANDRVVISVVAQVAS